MLGFVESELTRLQEGLDWLDHRYFALGKIHAAIESVNCGCTRGLIHLLVGRGRSYCVGCCA